MNGLGKITLYEHRFNFFLNTSATAGNLARSLFSDVQIEIIDNLKDRHLGGPYKIFKALMDVFNKLKGCDLKLIRNNIRLLIRKYQFRRFSGSRATILLSELLYELDFICDNVPGYNILYYDLGKDGFIGLKKEHVKHGLNYDREFNSYIASCEEPLERMLLSDIREDFMKSIDGYLCTIFTIKTINERYPITLGMWGVSPAWRTRAVVFEYLRSVNINVLGSQHGCLFGEVYNLWHFDADLNRCDHYLSWGFTIDDLRRIYPSREIGIEVHPFGKKELVKAGKVTKKIDIVFPIGVSISMFEGAMARMLPEQLTKRQLAILEYLDSLSLVNIYIKPIKGSNYTNCSVIPVLNRLKNVKVVDNVTLSSFLGDHSPKAVLVEYPSSPLFDALPLDAEIFLMGDPMNPYEERAFEELLRRVHFCADVDELISKMNLFLHGKLERKRDDRFFKHYMYKADTEKNILSLVDRLAARPEKRR